MKKSNKSWLVVALMIIVSVGLLGFNNFLFLFNPQAEEEQVSFALNDCIEHASIAMHIHPRLKIFIDGVEEKIPANVGISPTCMRSIHTHDDTGEMHLESRRVVDFKLKHFFAVWGQSFSRDQILDYVRDEGHDIAVTVDGKPNREYGELVLRDEQEIVIEYKATGGEELPFQP